jgi:hypothetical protein
MVHVDILRRPLGTYVIIAVVLGVVSLVLALAKVTGVDVVLYVLLAATAFAAGYAARTRSGHPAWSGAGAGVAFGIVSGIAAFFRKTTESQLKAALEKENRTISAASMSKALAVVNSPVVHVGSVLLSAVLFGLLGLILGAVAGAIAGGGEGQRRAV